MRTTFPPHPTPQGPNLILAGVFTHLFPQAPHISYTQWIAFGLPLSLTFRLLEWIVLCSVFCPPANLHTIRAALDRSVLEHEYHRLGRGRLWGRLEAGGWGLKVLCSESYFVGKVPSCRGLLIDGIGGGGHAGAVKFSEKAVCSVFLVHTLKPAYPISLIAIGEKLAWDERAPLLP